MVKSVGNGNQSIGTLSLLQIGLPAPLLIEAQVRQAWGAKLLLSGNQNDSVRGFKATQHSLGGTSPRLVACSGGVDSMLLATLAHRQKPEETIVVHAVGPAVPAAASKRVKRWPIKRNGNFNSSNTAGEFDDPEYLANPVNRCFHCRKIFTAHLKIFESS